MTRTLKTLPAVLVLLASPVLAAETYSIDRSHSDTTFQIRHLVSKVSGQFTDFDGTILVDRTKPEASSVEFVIRAASIDTRNADRDQHLRSGDFFDVEKHPEIRFKSTKVVPKAGDAYDVTGVLSLRGVERVVTLPVTFLGFVKDPWGNDRAGFEIAATVNRKDFGIVWNKALDNGGVILGDEAYISINIEAVKKRETASN